MKVYARRYGLKLSMESQRGIHILTEQDIRQGKITACPHCQTEKDCLKSGGVFSSHPFPERQGT
jgi:hypothetical protein